MRFIRNFLFKHQQRIIGLDILRSIAILIVVYGHGKYLLPKKFHLQYENFNFLKIDGVSIFFVLSGFLIGGILIKIIKNTNFTKKDLLDFWIRRWFRTIPNYLIVLVTLLILKQLMYNELGFFNLKYIFFLQNFFSPHPDFFSEAWSLTIEEWFYILFPLSCYILYKCIKNKSQSIIISTLIFITIPLLLRIIKFEYGLGVNDFDLEFRKITILRLDSLMYGVIGAYIYSKHPIFWTRSKGFLLIVGLTLLFLLNLNPLNWRDFYKPLYFNIESLTTFCFLPYLSLLKTTKNKIVDSIFIFISIISYSMYLIHLSIIQSCLIPIMNKLTGRNIISLEDIFVSNYITYWCFTLVGAFLLYHIYENPITKIRDKITSPNKF